MFPQTTHHEVIVQLVRESDQFVLCPTTCLPSLAVTSAREERSLAAHDLLRLELRALVHDAALRVEQRRVGRSSAELLTHEDVADLVAQFVDDLKHGAPSLVVRLGQCGHIGKGVTYGIVGGLMLWTAVVDRIGPPGLQTVFRMLNLSPSGGVLLWLKAIGLALFGVYCLAWAANRRR